MNNILFILLYVWLSVLFLWHGRYVRAGIGEKPLMLSSTVIQFFFNMLSLVWVLSTIYTLIFVNWKFVVLPLVAIFISRFSSKLTELIETTALLPILFLLRIIKKP